MTDPLIAALAKIEDGVAHLRVIEGRELDAHDIQEIVDAIRQEGGRTEKETAS